MIKTFGNRKMFFWVVGGFVLLLIVGALDYATGNEISFSVFYLIPILMLTWLTNEAVGALIAFVSAMIWLTADIFGGAKYSSPFIYVWNSVVRLIFFLLVTLLSKLGKDLERERVFSRGDFLTGAISIRYFYEVAEREIDRSARYGHPLTILYLDIDDFKTINDQFGHSVGDRLLAVIVKIIKGILRKTDIVARVGGDEFVVLFPELDETNARAVIPKLRQALLQEMQQKRWNVTCSIGALTFNVPPTSVDEMLTLADRTMYLVKNNGKDAITFDVYPSSLTRR
jgi:diguanylate cyclase (GGDEF)-like protein